MKNKFKHFNSKGRQVEVFVPLKHDEDQMGYFEQAADEEAVQAECDRAAGRE